MKTIQSYILERLVLSKTKSRHYITLIEFAKLFFPETLNEKDYFSEDTICDNWLLPYEISGIKQDTNPDNWQNDDISDIAKVLHDNINTEIDIDIQENKTLDAWDYYFELEWRKAIFKFCWVSTIDLRDKI
jgi:hypothetical protein